jgi:REP element-mobilizing transposase RayT
MSHTFTCLTYHIIFGTKDQRNLIPDNVQHKIHAYIAVLINNKFGFARCVDSVADHVHILCDLKPSHSVSTLLQNVKCLSSGWIRETFKLPFFSWQQGYGAFVVNVPAIADVKNYIENQKIQHKEFSFQEEFELLLRNNGIEYKPEYLFR